MDGRLAREWAFKRGRLAGSGKILTGRNAPATDGPFAEAKDVVGGYALISARDLDQAVGLARECPIFEVGGSIEVRPLRVME